MADFASSGEGRIRKNDESSKPYPSKTSPGNRLHDMQKKMTEGFLIC
jgi:hypothetical protein